MSHDRQTIMEANRSLRTIKNELENLLEKGVIDDSVYESIHATLPQESPLSGPLRTATSSNIPSNVATPASSVATPVRSPAPSSASTTNPPTQALANLSVNQSRSPAPPSYEDTPPPSLPARANTKPVIAHARALYQYNATDGRDLAFEKDEKISVYEYMNNDWWMGLNTRTNKEGIFPRNYVFVEHQEKVPAPAAPAQPQYGYPTNHGPPQQQNPYNSHVPPMAVSEGGQPSDPKDPSKAQQYGKKFGKKLGNAAIFGAGATIGGNIVNSIF